MIKEFHDVVVMELFFVDEYSRCCYTAHKSHGVLAGNLCLRVPIELGVRTEGVA